MKKLTLSRRLWQRIDPFKEQIESRWPEWAWMGWGRRPLARHAKRCSKWMRFPFLSLEDGWIRSLGNAGDLESYSLIVDDLGIYYDASTPSRLEFNLEHYNFGANRTLMEKAREAMEMIRRLRIAKYNHAPMLRPYEARKIFGSTSRERLLIVAQTAGDASLQYGLATESTKEMIQRARREHPKAQLYLKIHPDVFAGIKASDIDPTSLPSDLCIIQGDYNPYSLLEYVDMLYTKTSGMGMEALIAGKAVACSGLPWYAGWGLTQDRIQTPRRSTKRNLEELFAAAYLLYPLYCNPRDRKESSLEEVIRLLASQR